VGFFADGEVIDLVGRALNKIAGATRGFHRDVEHGMHVGTTFLMSWGNSARILVGNKLCINKIL
jgi:hypothetical protein